MLKKLFIPILVLSSSISACHLVKSVVYLRPDHHDDRKFSQQEISSSSNVEDLEYHETQLDPNTISLSYKNGEAVNLSEMLDNDLTNAFLIMKDGKILLERYYNKYDVDKTHGSFSVSKAMLATMLGLVLEEGLITSYQDQITKYIPELLENDPNFGEISIQHLFEMTSGIKVRGKDANPFGDLAKTYYGNNWGRFMRTIELDTIAGVRHQYNQTDAELLSLILTRVTGKSIASYFSEKVWQPIGANTAFWSTYKSDDLVKGFCCISARVQDFAKFAQLYLNEGKWKGVQIISPDWIAFTTNKTPVESKWNFSFHRFWFPANDNYKDYTAQGYNGQMIYINPTENIAILRFGKKQEENIAWEHTMRAIVKQIKD